MDGEVIECKKYESNEVGHKANPKKAESDIKLYLLDPSNVKFKEWFEGRSIREIQGIHDHPMCYIKRIGNFEITEILEQNRVF